MNVEGRILMVHNWECRSIGIKKLEHLIRWRKVLGTKRKWVADR